MIHRHAFNSEWWGAPVGLIRDPAFFNLSPADQVGQLGHFAWVEWQDDQDRVAPDRLHAAGFFQVDTQVRFRIRLQLTPEVREFATDLEVCPLSPDAPALTAADIRPFRHERFHALPGATEERVTDRFARWSGLLRNSDPDLALEIRLGGEVQGWYLAQADGKQLGLTLAMLSRSSRIGGLYLYAAAIQEYADRGFRQGHAAFSVRNTDVLNMYSLLGARFLTPKHCYMHVPTVTRDESTNA